jgi:hypothetical protein
MLLEELNPIVIHLNNIKNKLRPFVTQRIRKPADSKAVNDVIRQMYHLFAIHDIQIDEYINDFTANTIFNASILLTGGDLFSAVHSKYKDFAEELFMVRSTGLGTPNAASGEGELMALMLSPDVGISKKKDAGDLTVKGKSVELKGWAPRVFGSASGSSLNALGVNLCADYGIQTHSATKQRIAVEPWVANGKKREHWVNEFKKIGIPKAKEFLHKLMNGTGAKFDSASISNCFIGDVFSPEHLQREIIKKLFAATEKKWDFLTVIVDGKVETVSATTTDFEQAVDNGKIVPAGNFFRMFLSNPVGWYYRFDIAPQITEPSESS